MSAFAPAILKSNLARVVDKKILVVDDEAGICVEYLFQLREIGAKPQAFLPTNAAALGFLESHSVDAVILDYRLADGTSEPLMAWLRDHHIPFVVISGWMEKLARRAPDARILPKPASTGELCRALAGAIH